MPACLLPWERVTCVLMCPGVDILLYCRLYCRLYCLLYCLPCCRTRWIRCPTSAASSTRRLQST